MDKIYSSSEIIKGVLEELLSDVNKKRMKESVTFDSKWKEIVTSVKSVVNPNCGNSMYFHSKVIDVKDKSIILQVDHPGFIQLFETHKKYILRGIEMKMPQLNITNLSYKLDKKDDYDTQRDLTREELAAAIQKDFPEETEIQKNSSENKKYPPELEALFSRMRDSILTNDKKV